MAREDYTAAYGTGPLPSAAPGGKAPKPPTLKNSTKTSSKKKVLKVPKKSKKGIPYR